VRGKSFRLVQKFLFRAYVARNLFAGDKFRSALELQKVLDFKQLWDEFL